MHASIDLISHLVPLWWLLWFCVVRDYIETAWAIDWQTAFVAGHLGLDKALQISSINASQLLGVCKKWLCLRETKQSTATVSEASHEFLNQYIRFNLPLLTNIEFWAAQFWWWRYHSPDCTSLTLHLGSNVSDLVIQDLKQFLQCICGTSIFVA